MGFIPEGLEIEFDYGWETDLLKLVGSDELQFAIASGDQVILARSQFVTIVGPSGCGKSTLLHILGGLLAPTEGQVHLDDRGRRRGPRWALCFRM